MNILNEISVVRDEIERLNNRWGDLPMLESLTNNLVFLLSKFQQNPPDELTQKQQNIIAIAIVELLNTINKEIAWAKELHDTDAERNEWFKKAKYQVLKDTEMLEFHN